MRVILDTCVLYPTVLRKILLELASSGLFEPFWSEKIFEELLNGSKKVGALGQTQVRSEIAILKSKWPESLVNPDGFDLSVLWLPDKNDRHVLASAISCKADFIITLNIKDFPNGILGEFGLKNFTPDAFVRALRKCNSVCITDVIRGVFKAVGQNYKTEITLSRLLNKTYLPSMARLIT
ncbi:MAG: putative nucleic acid-binding protein [Paracoccaceae bacterium]|jgi:predicted nucleic acid-binding protein